LEPDISKKQNPLLFVRFLSVAGDRFPHRRQEKEEGRRLLQPPCFPFDFRGGAWRRRAATVHSHRRCPEFSSTVPEAIFVIFKCCCICLDTVVF
jgi:hypothetical protein